MTQVSIKLDGSNLTLAQLDGCLGNSLHIDMADTVWSRVERSANFAESIASGQKAAYGLNTGFGSLCQKRISLDQIKTLQSNLIISHAVGVGDPAPAEVVRFMMLFKLQALSHGVSGISRPTMTLLKDILNADLLPIVPTKGSLGASGDLAPLAHMALPLLGLGTVSKHGGRHDGATALKSAGLRPVELGPKEGLALINGTQFMSAYEAVMVIRSRRLVKQADIIACVSLEAIMGSIAPFDERLHQLRPHAGAIQVAQNIRNLMTDSDILPSHAGCQRVQDPYSLRCVPQVHGASRDALNHACQTVETEINSVTDNPIIFDNGDVISGGLFHGQPLALTLDYLAIALAELASISERRIYLLLSGIADLPVLLMKDTGLNSGFMLPQYTAAALVSENKGLCTPASVDSIPTSLGQEDHVSMGARAAVKCMQVLENTETVLAIEQLCAAQALDYRQPLQPGIGPRVALEQIRKVIPHAEVDRSFGDDIAKSLELLRDGQVIQSVEQALGTLH